MERTVLKFFVIGLFAALALTAVSPSASAQARATDVTADEAREIAVEAYIYAYPMVISELIGMPFSKSC
jgi:hypothetical protein